MEASNEPLVPTHVSFGPSLLQDDCARIPIADFVNAINAASAEFREIRDQRLDALPIGQPIVDPNELKLDLAQDDMAALFGATMRHFNYQTHLAKSCMFRQQLLLRLVTKRRFKRYRRANADGSTSISGKFVAAVCGMRFKDTWIMRGRIGRRRIRRELLRELRRLTALCSPKE